MKPVIVKLGGSAITVKSKRCTPNMHVIEACVRQISEFADPLVLLHGGGSFAHPFVTEAGLQFGYRHESQLNAVSETELFLDQLTRIIGAGLLLHKKPFVPIRPMSFITLKSGRIFSSFLEPIRKAVGVGLAPLIHGDLVFDIRLRIGVLSADVLASFLGTKLQASRALFGCDVDGVYSHDPKSSSRAVLVEKVTKSNYKSVLGSFGSRRGYDATGGMFRKVAEAVRLARSGIESVIFNVSQEGLLADAMMGKPVRGTRFVPWRER